MTNLMEAVHAFADDSGRIKTPTSRESFLKVMRHLHRHLNDGDAVDIDEVSAEDLTEWCLSGDRPAPSTIRKRRSHARSFFAWCAWKGFVPKNAASDLEFSVQPGTGGVRTHTWLTEDQAAAMLRPIPNGTITEQRDRIILLLGVMCGLRAGVEMARLEWSWLSSDMRELTVHEGKGRKTVTIGVPDQCADGLRDWKRKRPIGARPVLPRTRWAWHPAKRRRALMVDWDTPLGYSGILAAVKRIGKRFGVELRPHDLRRSFAGILESKGVAVSDIARAMRHADVGVTSRYLEKNPAKTVAVTAGFRIGGSS